MLSVLNLMILHLHVDSVEDFAGFDPAVATPADVTNNFHKKIIRHRAPSLRGHRWSVLRCFGSCDPTQSYDLKGAYMTVCRLFCFDNFGVVFPINLTPKWSNT